MAMAGKTAIVSGASSGIGRATAIELVKNGYKVYAFNRSPAEITGVEFVPVDISKPEDIKRGVAAVLEREDRVDLLVNNAGMCVSGAAEETTDENAYYLFDVNFFGAFRLAREVLPSMRAAGGGRIINVTSIAAVFFPPFQGFYCASKAALSAHFFGDAPRGQTLRYHDNECDTGGYPYRLYGSSADERKSLCRLRRQDRPFNGCRRER